MELKNTTLDDVAAIIGFSATLRLSAWFGDAGNLYVPSVVTEDQVLSKLIGVSAAKRLSAEWGRQHLALPRLRAYEDDVKKRVIARMLEHKMGTREIAGHMRMSERRVQQITRELEASGLIAIVLPVKNQPEKSVEKIGGMWSGLQQTKE
jgi:hypothetical protein